MRRIEVLFIPVMLVALLGLAACVPGWGQPGWGGGGMMGGQGGMMGGQGGMMGGGQGNYNPGAKPITIEQAADAVNRYLNAYRGNLALTEVMDFTQNFYAEVEEKDTGIHATELLIDKYSGQVYPEYGPNMMWNTKYSMMSNMMGNFYRNQPTANMTVTPEKATELAQKWLDINLPVTGVAEADTFYGYYTLHTLKGGQVTGMLSVNGYSGQVWYHNWHGLFITMKEFE